MCLTGRLALLWNSFKLVSGPIFKGFIRGRGDVYLRKCVDTQVCVEFINTDHEPIQTL